VLEAQAVTLAESQHLLAALAGQDRDMSATLIAGCARRHRIPNVERALRRAGC
jgi:hypothetical protein